MKKQKISPERTRMIQGAIAYLRFKGFHEIKTVQEGFKDPRAVFTKASEAGFTPHMIAEKDFGTYIFEMIDSALLEDWDANAEKWQVFDEYAKRKSGKLYFITYSDDADAVSEKLESMDIEPSLIKIRK